MILLSIVLILYKIQIGDYTYLKDMQLDIVSQKLDIIFLTDLHLQVDQTKKLAKQIKSQAWHFDYCLVGGDIGTIDHSDTTHGSQTQAKQIQELLVLLYDLFQCKVIFIPGNHDPLAYLNENQQIAPEIINIHKKQFVLEVGLSIVGLGGSMPAYSDPQHTQQRWKGFPYRTEQEYSKEVKSVFKQDDLHTSRIYLTHMGPEVSHTSQDRHKLGQIIYGGSKSLNSLLQDKNLLALLHGNVHNGSKYDTYLGKPIINPGAFQTGEYAILCLTRLNKEWKLTKVSFERLL